MGWIVSALFGGALVVFGHLLRKKPKEIVVGQDELVKAQREILFLKHRLRWDLKLKRLEDELVGPRM